MAGILAITGVDLGHSTRALIGDLLALGGGLAAAGYMLMGEHERRHLPAAVYTASTYGVAAVLILPVCLVSGSELAGFPARGWLEIAVITVFAQLLGHTLLNVAVPVVGATPMSLALLLEVPGAALIAWVWYGERPPVVILPGSAPGPGRARDRDHRPGAGRRRARTCRSRSADARAPSRSASQMWMPHSVLDIPAQRPERASSPGLTGWVHGSQPIER